MRAMHWFRRDLRLDDNTALADAARRSDDGVVALFVVCPGMWREHDDAPVKVEFWLRALASLRPRLEALNIPLLVRTAPQRADIPRVVLEAARDAGADALCFNEEYELNERRRDDAVALAIEADGRAVHRCTDRVVLAPGEVMTKDGGPYTVFTPFQNRWAEVLEERGFAPEAAPPRQPETGVASEPVPGRVEGFESSVDPSLWPASEDEAARRLGAFAASRIGDYADRRDRPAVDGTSALSAYLNAGVVSVRRCLEAAMGADGGRVRLGRAHKGPKSGPAAWISELVWREFYLHITDHFPRVCMGRSFRPEYDAVPWRDDAQGFDAWREGRTGFPFVDAAMRQLNETGWMHNRVRMVAAMFLTKDLLVDWRLGERHFMRTLIDGDLGPNNGGWQWSASTGTDAAPYFRVYNPTTQAQRYDPDGAFVRRWVPELAGVEGKAIFEPVASGGLLPGPGGYPAPIVDHSAARQRVLDVFKAVGESRAARDPVAPAGG